VTIAPADIQALPSGEFAALADAVIQPFIDEAVREVNTDVFGDRTDDATKYLAAHLLACMIDGSRGAAGPIVQERAGPLGRMYAIPNRGTDGSTTLGATTYGRRYMELQRLVAGGPRAL